MTTVLDVQRLKDEGRRFAMLTAYDFLSARILDEAGIPILLVGDSLGMVMLGHPTTLPVTLEDMLHHAKAVARGARQALLVGDMPFMSYHVSIEQAITTAGRFLQEAGMHSVKLEGGGRLCRRRAERAIPGPRARVLGQRLSSGLPGVPANSRRSLRVRGAKGQGRGQVRRLAPRPSSRHPARCSTPRAGGAPSADRLGSCRRWAPCMPGT